MDANGWPCELGKSDAALMKQLVEGNAEAMEAIYDRYKASLRSVILSVLHEGFEAEEVLHEAFLELWNQAAGYLPEKGLQGLLVTIARRRAFDRVRRKLAYRRAMDRFEVHAAVASDHRRRLGFCAFTNADLADLMEQLIRQLPEAQQEVVRLMFYEGLSPGEIAARNALPLGTVKTRLHLAQKKLLDKLTAQERKVYKFIKAHRGCTTRDIINGTYVTSPSGRITEMRKKGINIISIGKRKYEGARAFEEYAIVSRLLSDKLTNTCGG